jgi:multidrug efflux pump subunit AcrB
MMLENIVRHYEMGKTRRQAAIDGSNEITFAAMATTLAIAAIFIPVIFMKGVVGQFFYQYGITVTVAVFLSLLEAITLTPMRCARFMHSAHENPTRLSKAMDHFMTWLSDKYRSSLDFTLGHRWQIILVSVAVFAASLVFVSTLRKELIPPQDQSMFVLNIKTPVGSAIEATDVTFKKAEAYLRKRADVQDLYTTIGNYEHNNVVNAGTIYVILTDVKKRKQIQQEIMEEVRGDLKKLLPDSDVFGQDLSLTGFSASRGFPVEYTVEGPDWELLKKYNDQITARLKTTGLLEDLNSDYQDGMDEIQIQPDRDKTAAMGVPISTIGQEIYTLIGGEIFNANTQFPIENHRYYIRVRAQPDQTSSPDDLTKVMVRNNRGEMSPLKDQVTFKEVKAPEIITRYARRRSIPMFANVAYGKSQQDALDAVQKVGKEVLPPGYYLRIQGSGDAFQEAFQGLIFALLLGVAIAYMILASQFNSFIHPITILMALPFSLSGALLALWVCHQSLSLFSMIGLILLMGIVKKNSILLVDFTNQRRAEGFNVHDALLHACPVRLRPILMTSIATVAGAIPEALNFGAGAETRIPMAISLIGGVTLSTFLTLYVVPCVYSLFSRLERPELDDEAEQRLEQSSPDHPPVIQGAPA